MEISSISLVLLAIPVVFANFTLVQPSPNYVLTNANTFWPPLGFACHQWYDNQKQQTFPQAQINCRDESSEQRRLLKEKVRITDWKTCILWRLKGVVFDGATPVWRSNRGLRRSLLIVMSGLHNDTKTKDKKKAKVETLLQNSANCANVLDKMIRNKLPTTKWGEFHTCVETAWTCESKKG